MKNVAVTMGEGVAEWARLEAARRNAGVLHLAGETLAGKRCRDDADQRAHPEALKFEPMPFEAHPLRRDEIHAARLDRLR